VETGSVDSNHLLAAIDELYNPYTELNLLKNASQAEIEHVVKLRRRQIEHKRSQLEQKLLVESPPAETSEYLPAVQSKEKIELELVKLVESENAVALAEQKLGTLATRRAFDKEYDLAVHNIIWQDLSATEKALYKINHFLEMRVANVTSKIPPALANRVENGLTRATRQKEVIQKHLARKQTRISLFYLYVLISIFVIGCVGADVSRHDGAQMKKCEFMYGENIRGWGYLKFYVHWCWLSVKQIWQLEFIERWFQVNSGVERQSVVTEYEERDLSFQTQTKKTGTIETLSIFRKA